MSQSANALPPQEGGDAPRRGRPAAIREDALRAGRTAFARAGFPDPTLVLDWHAIAGAEIARLSSPIKWLESEKGAVLTLACDPGSVVFLVHQTRALTERLNAYLGKSRIARIRCVPVNRPSKPDGLPHPTGGATLLCPTQPSRRLPLREALDRLRQARTGAGMTHPLRPPD